MRGVHGSGWQVHHPAAGLDPFLAATLWLLDRDCGALVGAPRPGASVHARTLAEAVPRLDPARPGTAARQPGLGIVLVEPGPAVLEALDRNDFADSCAAMLLPSPPDDAAHPWQAAWVWAQRHNPPRLGNGSAPLIREHLDPFAVLTDEEVWALALRAGAGRTVVASLRRSGHGESAASSGLRRLARWRS